MDNHKQLQQEIEDFASMVADLQSDFKTVQPHALLNCLKNNKLTQLNIAGIKPKYSYSHAYWDVEKNMMCRIGIEVTFLQKALLQYSESSDATWLEIAKVILEHDCPRETVNQNGDDALLLVLKEICDIKRGVYVRDASSPMALVDSEIYSRYKAMIEIFDLILEKNICIVDTAHISSAIHTADSSIVHRIVSREKWQSTCRNSQISQNRSFVCSSFRSTAPRLLYWPIFDSPIDYAIMWSWRSFLRAQTDSQNPQEEHRESEAVQIFKRLLEAYPSLVNDRDQDGNTLLLCALNAVYIRTISEDYDQKHYDAQLSDSIAVLQCLLKRTDLDIHLANQNNQNFHDLLNRFHQSSPVRCFISYLLRYTGASVVTRVELFVAAQKGDLDYLLKAIEGFNQDAVLISFFLNFKDERGRTVLHVAAEQGHQAFVQTLLQQVDSLGFAKDQHTNTPLHVAAANGHLDVVHVFLQCPWRLVRLTNSEGRTPLHMAALNGHLNVVKVIVEAEGEFIDRTDQNGQTAAILAKKYGHIHVEQYLVSLCSLGHLTPILTFSSRKDSLSVHTEGKSPTVASDSLADKQKLSHKN